MNVVVPKWGPRLARLYSLDIRQLEKRHAGVIAPGTTDWESAIRALYKRMHAGGPVKGAKLLRKVSEYLNGIEIGERAHMVLAYGAGKRSAHLVLATFSVGHHPDPAVREEGLSIALHVVECRRSRPRCATGIGVAFLQMHALKRIFERSDFGNEEATSTIAYQSVLGYLVHRDVRHFGGDMNLLVAGLMLTGAIHRFRRALPNGRVVSECIFDVRTALELDELGPGRQPDHK